MAEVEDVVVEQVKEISLGDGFGDVAVRANGARVVIHADGKVESRDVCEAVASIAPQVGDPMPDGTIYAGISPDTKKPMYATPKDAPLTMQWKQAMDYAAALDAHGHKDWRAPTKSELNVLFQNRAAIGGFDISGSSPAGWYWSSSQNYNFTAWAQRFSDGDRSNYPKHFDSSLRCVR